MKNKKVVRIIIGTGHTGGHFFPAVSFAEAFLKEHPGAEVHFLMSRLPSFVGPYLAQPEFRIHLIRLRSISKILSLKIIVFLLECIVAFLKTFLLFLKVRPHLVVGFGSLTSVPGVFWAALLGRPILLHEQNAQMGRANQFLAPFAQRIGLSFPVTQGRVSSRKAFWSGYPLRSSFLAEFEKRFSGNEKLQAHFTILVFGGSQGAQRLNEAVLSMFEVCCAEERIDFAVIHIVGTNDLNSTIERYRALNINSQVYAFTDRITECYHEADLVISRAGAGTIFELACVGRPAILIPYPHAYAHQRKNAMALVEEGAVRMIEEEHLTSEALSGLVFELKRDNTKRVNMIRNILKFYKPEASRALVQAGWELICKKN